MKRLLSSLLGGLAKSCKDLALAAWRLYLTKPSSHQTMHP
jgi:hypothetical protein